MKVFISADMEGVSGLTHSGEMFSGGNGFEEARRLLTADVNAAIDGAYKGGASEVLVNDSHYMMRNLVTQEVDVRAKVIRGRIKRGSGMEGLDESFHAVFLIGYHAKHGTPFGVMNHTMLGREIQNIYINNEPVGEMSINGLVAGQMGVPVVLVTGDDITTKEAEDVFGGIELATVKEGRGRFTAKLLHPSVSQKIIRDSAARAVKRASEIKPFQVEMPVCMGFEFTSTAMAEVCSWIPTIERVGPRSIQFDVLDWKEGTGLMNVVLWLAAGVADPMY